MTIQMADTFKPVKPKTLEMATLLSAGYQMSVEDAREIVAAREKDSAAYSISELRRAQAFLEAYGATPKVVATRPMFKPAEEEN